jgi:protein-serine/threonine kinase
MSSQHLTPDQPATKSRPDDCMITLLSLCDGPETLYLSLDVYFERSTAEFSSDAIARSTAAKLKLESYYKVAVDAAIERNARFALHAPSSFLDLNERRAQQAD